MPHHLSRELVVQSYTNTIPNTLLFKVSASDAIAAFAGGVYVSFVVPDCCLQRLISAGIRTWEIRHWPGAKNHRVGGSIIS